MSKIRNIVLLSLAVFAFGVAGVNAQSFAGDASRPSTPIEQQIYKRLIRLPYYGLFDHISYKVDGSTVTLYGKVISLGTRKAAEREVKRIDGVTQVVNNIEDLPLSSLDNEIRYRLVSEFNRAPGLYMYLREPNPSVRIIVDRGHVTLEGYVNNRGTARTMNILANGIPGVFGVTNNLVVERDLK